jgi:hypothetical protein
MINRRSIITLALAFMGSQAGGEVAVEVGSIFDCPWILDI